MISDDFKFNNFNDGQLLKYIYYIIMVLNLGNHEHLETFSVSGNLMTLNH
jgi:hypothetical protein